MAILVTGGIGYIGSHTVIELLNQGEEIVVVDNLSNSKIETVDLIKKITKKDFKFYELDIVDRDALEKVFNENDIKEVIHFAGFKAVGESIEEPVKYYYNNITGSINLLDIMKEHNCKKIVFSSSATVYGKPESVPIKEDARLQTTNPYGTTKLMFEMILKDTCRADNDFSAIILRYFNPIGAHESGLIGESPKGIPSNLMPYIAQVAAKKLKCLKVFGDDYDTVDGTGVRDYIHVVDLAKGHVKAIQKVRSCKGIETYNLGTGKGYSVLELVNAFEKVNNVKINHVITERRLGDIGECYADPSKAEQELGWKAEKNIEEMCKDTWNFVKNKYEL